MRVRILFSLIVLLAAAAAALAPGVGLPPNAGASPAKAASRPKPPPPPRRLQDAQPDRLREAVKIEPGERRELVKALEKQLKENVIYDEQTGVLVAERASGRRSLFDSTLGLARPGQQVTAVQTYKLGDVTGVDAREVEVKFEQNVSEEEALRILRQAQAGEVVKREGGNQYTVEVAPNRLSEEVAQTLSQAEGVASAEQSLILIFPPRPQPEGKSPGPMPAAAPSAFPFDPHFRQQWGLENRGLQGRPNADIRVMPVWRTTRGSDSIKIAILDEGVETDHPDLSGKIVCPYDATRTEAKEGDRCDNAAPADVASQMPNSWDIHGTACAGVAAAVTGNGVGIAGVAWDSKIIPIKVAKQLAKDEGWTVREGALALGIYQAIERKANVISLSWGGGQGWTRDDVRKAIEEAIAAGVVVVAAAGNAARPEVDFPASMAGERGSPTALPVIAVGATNEKDELITLQNCTDPPAYVWGSNHGKELTVVAPGINILTTDNRGARGKSPTDYLTNFTGTSSATPLVAGVAALILSKHPDWTPQQVKDQIIRTADDLGPPGPDDFYGHGRVNACRALELPDCGGLVSGDVLRDLWPPVSAAPRPLAWFWGLRL